MEHSQLNISQSNNSLVSIVSDTHTTTSRVTTLSVVECLTISSSVVTSISGPQVSTVTTSESTTYHMYINESFNMLLQKYKRMPNNHTLQ